ncbi:MAG: phosphatase PAP2 family protein [Waddliaceae bacterium]|jgi:Kdo2-lipid A phosphotransferase|nr:phosphatase PAP2 family protein [Waddliaceae bacterium]MBT3579217.1 phosphatase PAP2 family protein [Waddliaceae bacterium]MBT4444283.1 phosphatase PAP2 family protein [Waddliaceae bacterium]MBT6928916.1 phosphatase PAP2 family protein [Waddliaceae bacterium]MBT7264163.1 phosphatase PAP2 family protein [Waddliaceae bacterium]
MNNKRLYIFFIIIAIFVASWFVPITRSIWDYIDRNVFLSLNGSLVGHVGMQKFFAWLNSRYADWMFEGIAVGVYLAHCIIKGEVSRRQRLQQLLFLLLYIAAIQVFVNKTLCLKILRLSRQSPSLVLPVSVDLSIFPYLNNKVFSYNSFPADHATSLFIVSFFSWSHFRRPVAIVSTILYTFLALPRIIAGSHWFSDVFFGGLCFAAIAWVLAMSIPLLRRLSHSTSKKI